MALYYSKGTISHMSEITSGTSQSGRAWARMTIMIDVPGYQGSIYKQLFLVGTERINDVCQFKIGDKVEIGWSIYAREWNDKWYNNVDLVNIKAAGVQASAPSAPAPQTTAPAENQSSLDPQEGDLPF